MSTPLPLSAEEFEILTSLARPITPSEKQQFLSAVADALSACPQPGPGRLYQTAREIQRTFTKAVQHEISIAAAPRHLGAKRVAPEGA
jgi:hypothetical protein